MTLTSEKRAHSLDRYTCAKVSRKTLFLEAPRNIDFGIDKINGKSKCWATFEVSDDAIVEEVVRKFNRYNHASTFIQNSAIYP